MAKAIIIVTTSLMILIVVVATATDDGESNEGCGSAEFVWLDGG